MINVSQLTDEIENLWIRIATLDGWTDIEKKEVDGFVMFCGRNSTPKTERFFFSVPDYPFDQSAIALLFKEKSLYYQVAWMPTHEPCERARASDINDREFRCESEAIAMCKLFLSIQENE